MPKPDRPTYVLKLRPLPKCHPVRALKLLLKWLLRAHGFECLEAYEDKPAAPVDPPPAPAPKPRRTRKPKQ